MLAQHEQAAQALDHRQQQRHVGGIGGHQEGGNRPVGPIEHDAKHDLLQNARGSLWNARTGPSSRRRQPSNHYDVVSMKAIETVPSCGRWWR